MTVTVVFGKTSDGYLHSYDAAYATARNGPADGATQGAGAWVGQAGPSTYRIFEAFLGYDYPAIANTEIVTAAALRTFVTAQRNPTLAQDLEHRFGASWSGSGLTTGDWRAPAALASAVVDGAVQRTSAATVKFVWASSDELLLRVRASTSIEHVAVTSRQRAGNVPSTDEGVAITTADEAGTTYDPALVYTSAPRSTLFGVLGAQVKVSTGHAFIESNGATPTPTYTLRHRTPAGVLSTIATLPISSTSPNAFWPPQGAQGFALVADPAGNLFIFGRYSGTENTLAYLPFQKGSGATWTQRQMRSSALPSYGGSINNVAAAYHAVSGGTIYGVVGHSGSVGTSTQNNELTTFMVNPNVLIAQQGTVNPTRALGFAVPAVQPVRPSATHFNTYANETGTGLDVSGTRGGQAAWGYVYSFGKGAVPGENGRLAGGRYVLNSGGNGYSHASTFDLAWGRKDAAGKVRVVPISATAAAYISTDQDAGYGITVRVQNHTGTEAGSVQIGQATFGGELPATMPDGPVVAQSAAWDAILNSAENRLWIYYASGVAVYRTAFDLNTMQRKENEILVHTAAVGTTIQAIRVSRNEAVESSTLVSIATLNGTTRATAYVTDTFNIAPNAPTLTPRANFDATTAQTFTWTVNDLSGDAQTAYQLEVTDSSTGVVALDTGKVLSATPSRNVAGGTIPNGASYQWRVRTWDAQDADSPWSDYGTFTTAAGGNVTITYPATDNPLDLITDDLTVTWSVTGSVQAAYRVWLYRNGTELVSDTGWLASTATAHTITGMLSDVQHEVRVQTRNASAVVTNLAVRQLKPSYSTPELPLLSAQPLPLEGYTLLVVDNPAPGAPALGFAEDDFEAGVGTWQAGPNAAITASAAQAHKGTQSLRLASTLDGQDPVYARDYGNFRAVTAGTRYTARMWVWAPVLTQVSATIDWSNSLFAYQSSSSFGVAIQPNQWTAIQVTGTAPVDGFAVYGPSITAGPVSGTYIHADEIILTGASDRPDVAANEILRRLVDDNGPWEVVGTTGPDGTFRDYTAAPGVAYHYIARGVA